MHRWKLKLKRGEVWGLAWLPGFVRKLQRVNLPMPGIFRPLFRLLYGFHYSVIVIVRRLLIFFYKEPLFRSRCAKVGRNLQLYTDLPYVSGHAEISIGDDVTITGGLTIISGRFVDRPTLTVKDRVVLGGGSSISVNLEVLIEDDVMISTNCSIADNDGHPREAHLRAAHAPLSARDMRPVRIRRYAWIGNGAQIRKGVTIGEGAIIGANSVVISDIPDYCVAMGNPAEVYFRNVGRRRPEPA
jgi:acetyltransferase-like isoleucine patch superfamily enzyme